MALILTRIMRGNIFSNDFMYFLWQFCYV